MNADVKAIVWRSLKVVKSDKRLVVYARALGYRLEVAVCIHQPTGTDYIVARVERRQSHGGWWRIGQNAWNSATEAMLAEARAWCEATAAEARP